MAEGWTSFDPLDPRQVREALDEDNRNLRGDAVRLEEDYERVMEKLFKPIRTQYGIEIPYKDLMALSAVEDKVLGDHNGFFFDAIGKIPGVELRHLYGCVEVVVEAEDDTPKTRQAILDTIKGAIQFVHQTLATQAF